MKWHSFHIIVSEKFRIGAEDIPPTSPRMHVMTLKQIE